MRSAIFGGSSAAPSTTAVNYQAVNGSGISPSATEVNFQAIVTSAGFIRGLAVSLGTAPGAGTQYDYILRLNNGDSALKVTIAGTDTKGSDDVHSIAVVAGDIIDISITPTNTPASSGVTLWSMEFEGTVGKESIFPSGDGSFSLSTSATEYLTPFSVNALGPGTTEPARYEIVPTGGTIKKFYVNLTTAPGALSSRTFKVFVNGAPSGIAVTISDLATSGNDTANSIAVNAGDTVSIESSIGASPAASKVQFGMTFVATIDGESFVAGQNASTQAPSTTVTNYIRPVRAGGAWNATETVTQVLGRYGVFRKLYVLAGAAPSAGKSYTFTIRQNVGPTALVATLADANTSVNNTTNEIEISKGDLVAVECAPSGTPTATGALQWSMVFVVLTGSSSSQLLSMGVG